MYAVLLKNCVVSIITVYVEVEGKIGCKTNRGGKNSFIQKEMLPVSKYLSEEGQKKRNNRQVAMLDILTHSGCG